MMTSYMTIQQNCPKTQVKNRTTIWTELDRGALERAEVGCVRYYSDRHCLSRFYKIKKNTYQAVCIRTRDLEERIK